MNDNEWRLFVFMLKEIAESKGITQNQIAEKTGIRQENISSFYKAEFTPRLDLFLTIAKAIGVNFFIEDKESKTDLNLIFEKAMKQLGRRPDKLPKN